MQFARITKNMRREGCNERKVNILRMVTDVKVKNKTEKPVNMQNESRRVEWKEQNTKSKMKDQDRRKPS